MELEFLRKLGLSKGEIKVYSAMLELGPAAINKIHERTGIERRNIYDILNKLIERGLVAYVTENKKRFFHIAHPKNIIGYVEQKKHRLDIVENEIRSQLPTLLKQFEFTKPEINAEIYRGFEGVKAVWEDMLNYRVIHWLGSGRYIPKWQPHFFTSWNKRRVKKKIRMLNIMRHELKREIKNPYEFEEIRYLPTEFSGNPVVIGIFGNKTASFILGKEVFIFVIESNELAHNYTLYHKYLWDNVAKE